MDEKIYGIKFNGVWYAFSKPYTRVVDSGKGSYYFHNAPKEVDDIKVVMTIDGSALPSWGYREVFKGELHNHKLVL